MTYVLVVPSSNEEIAENEGIVDNSEWGRNFHMLIKNSIKQMSYSIKQKMLEGTVVQSGAAQLLISKTAHILAEDLLRRSLAAAHQRYVYICNKNITLYKKLGFIFSFSYCILQPL